MPTTAWPSSFVRTRKLYVRCEVQTNCERSSPATPPDVLGALPLELLGAVPELVLPGCVVLFVVCCTIVTGAPCGGQFVIVVVWSGPRPVSPSDVVHVNQPCTTWEPASGF